ncbi:hypothetical protein [Actinoplanes sp. NPDC051411]|uniref:hypothetical protein n=1 Tax=Actinoplanes sp. NPDC051411 TaxID=3155522 RepID=UPI00342DEC5C
MLVPGTLAYWRFDQGGANGTPFASSQSVRDRSGHGNDLSPAVVPGSAADALTWSNDHHPDQPGHGSLRFAGGRNPLHGAYLTTAAAAVLNKETFTRGYTVEAFVKFPLDWDAGNNGWMSVISRRGSAGQAGKQGRNTDPQEPVGASAATNTPAPSTRSSTAGSATSASSTARSPRTSSSPRSNGTSGWGGRPPTR